MRTEDQLLEEARENIIIEKARDKSNIQSDIAEIYAQYIYFYLNENAEFDWPRVNQAIIDRWSKSGLNRIKTQAWKILEH